MARDDPIRMIASNATTDAEEAAGRSELAAKYRHGGGRLAEVPESALPLDAVGFKGTILEAAFVDPAYTWPSADGQGKNAIELKASPILLKQGDDEDSVYTTQSAAQRMRSPTKPRPKKRGGIFACCRSDQDIVSAEEMRAYQEQKMLAKEARENHAASKDDYYKKKEKAAIRAAKYETVPEGILLYRLDTATGRLSLVSQPHAHTNLDAIVQDCTVTKAVPGADKSRRALEITDQRGNRYTLTACEQRTATAWLEVMNLMHAKNSSKGRFRKVRSGRGSWKDDGRALFRCIRLFASSLTEL